jgi:hypothetical protein
MPSVFTLVDRVCRLFSILLSLIRQAISAHRPGWEREGAAHHSIKPLKLSINIDFNRTSPAQLQRKILSRLQPLPPSSIPPATMQEWRTPLEAGFCVVHIFQEFRNVEDCSA